MRGMIESVVDTFSKDAVYAFRLLARSPGFAVTAVISLGLGIGASALIFSVVNAVLLRPLPYHDSDRLVWIWSVTPGSPLKGRASYPDFNDWSSQNSSFESIVGWGRFEVVLTGAGDPERLDVGLTKGDLFSLLGVSPLIGTSVSGNSPSGQRPVVLSHSMWRRVFNLDPNVIGRGIKLSGQTYSVAGVMPAGFEFPVLTGTPVDLWMNLERFNPELENRREARLIEVIARLRADVTHEQAQADMDVIAARLRSAYPGTNRNIWVRLVGVLDEATGGVSRRLLAVSAAIGIFLLLACVNICSLLIARIPGRRRELALRSAVGAGRGRIMVQLLMESLLIAAGAGVVGSLLAAWGTEVFRLIEPADLPRASNVTLDAGVLAFIVLTALASGLSFGLASAWHASSGLGVIDSLQGGHTLSHTGRNLSGILVIGEIALAMVLLTGAGLFLNSLWRLVQFNPGFDPRNVLTFTIDRPWNRREPAEAFRELQRRLLAIPGVVAASTGLQLPDRGEPRVTDVSPFLEIEGQPADGGGRERASVIHTQPGYFRVMGIPLLRGRDFGEGDVPGAPRVVIINESIARRYFPDEDPIGKRLTLESWTLYGARTQEIVGVAADVTHYGLRTAGPLVYVPLEQAPRQGSAVVVRTQDNPLNYVSAVRAAVRAVDGNQPVENLQTLEQRIARELARDRFSAVSLTAFATFAVTLAGVGLYGLMSIATARRTSEIAIRAALGASRRDIVMTVLGRAMILTAAGVVLGLAGALALTRLVDNLLFGITATDPTTLIIVTLVLTAVVFLASWIPVRRAIRMDPSSALRHTS